MARSLDGWICRLLDFLFFIYFYFEYYLFGVVQVSEGFLNGALMKRKSNSNKKNNNNR